MSVIRMFTRLLQPLRFVQPWQTTPFWSRTPFTFNAYAVKFLLRPCDLDHGGFLGWFQTFWRARADADYLRNKLAERLRHSDVTFDFRVQLFVDEERTPIEDASREWKESIAPFRTLAQLIIPKQNLDDPLNADIERMAFDPWHTEDHRPLGRMNRARRLVYPTSAKARLQERPVDEC
jgi:hypothetical protein